MAYEWLYNQNSKRNAEMWWGTPGNCLNHGEILKHPASRGYKDQIKTLEYIKFVKKLPSEKVRFS